jgi:hypothetical protein
MHTREDNRESNVFAEGLNGWKMAWNFLKGNKKKPEQQQQSQQPQGDGYNMTN